ncbi:SRPBCC family protein [Chryseobacterium sp.]|uniref:SRPBCC family protein n=1 Tax=Chryseobacterium sp. TaxID=1871047 RepID=UPI002FCA52F3
MDNYSSTIEIITMPDKVYDALTHKIPFWWTEMFKGSSGKTNEVFTARFGDHIHKTIRVKDLVINSKVIWYVEDSLIAIPELKNQKEWMGTTIVWEIEKKDNRVLLTLTHIGLHPLSECYDICSNGWLQFISSLKLFLETGKGVPYKE